MWSSDITRSTLIFKIKLRTPFTEAQKSASSVSFPLMFTFSRGTSWARTELFRWSWQQVSPFSHIEWQAAGGERPSHLLLFIFLVLLIWSLLFLWLSILRLKTISPPIIYILAAEMSCNHTETSCRVRQTYLNCVVGVLRLCHCAQCVCCRKGGVGRWKDRWWEERKVLILMWHMAPVYTYLSVLNIMTSASTLLGPLTLQTPHICCCCLFVIKVSSFASNNRKTWSASFDFWACLRCKW